MFTDADQGPDPGRDPDFGEDRSFMAVPREEREAAERARDRVLRERARARARVQGSAQSGAGSDAVQEAARAWVGPWLGASGRREVLYSPASGGFPLHGVDEIEQMVPAARERYLRMLWQFSLEHEFPESVDPWRVWERWLRRCTWEDTLEAGGTGSGQRCERESVAGTRKCMEHVSRQEFDPAGYAADRAAQARLRLAGALESAADAVEGILNAPTELPEGWEPGDPGPVPAPVSAALRLKAAELVFDRAGVPKVTESAIRAEVNSTVTIEEGQSPGEIIRARLERLADSFTQTQLEGIAAATQNAGTDPDAVVDAEWVQDEPEGTL